MISRVKTHICNARELREHFINFFLKGAFLGRDKNFLFIILINSNYSNNISEMILLFSLGPPYLRHSIHRYLFLNQVKNKKNYPSPLLPNTNYNYLATGFFKTGV